MPIEQLGQRFRTVSAIAAMLLAPLVFALPAANGANGDQRGDCNDDGRCDLSDVVFIIQYLFYGGNEPDCLEKCDVSIDGSQPNDPRIDITDITALLAANFFGVEVPPLPPGACDDAPPVDPPPTPNDERFDFTWDAAQASADAAVAGYRLYWRTRIASDYSDYQLVNQVDIRCTCASLFRGQLPDPETGQVYCFSVTAFDDQGNESGFSDEVEVVDW